jgi:hypothetical protein
MLEDIDGTEGSIVILELLEDIWKAFVCAETSSIDRLKYAVSAVYFIRYWQQDCEDKEVAKSHYMIKNSWDGLELNLGLLLRLIIDGEAHNIHQHNSQNCEAYFRKARSYTPVGSTMVNFDPAEFQKRAHKIAYEEKVYIDVEGISFPKMENRATLATKHPEHFTDIQIEEAVKEGINLAQQRALKVDITNFSIDLKFFLRPPKNMQQKQKSFVTPVNCSQDLELIEGDSEIDTNLNLENVSFTQEASGIF